VFSQSELDPLDFGFALGRCPRSSEEKRLLTWMMPFLLHTIGFEDVKSLQPDSNVISEAMSFQVKVLVGLLVLAKLLLWLLPPREQKSAASSPLLLGQG
jgi:hypothetical protein